MTTRYKREPKEIIGGACGSIKQYIEDIYVDITKSDIIRSGDGINEQRNTMDSFINIDLGTLFQINKNVYHLLWRQQWSAKTRKSNFSISFLDTNTGNAVSWSTPHGRDRRIVQGCRISIGSILEIMQSCTKPSRYTPIRYTINASAVDDPTTPGTMTSAAIKHIDAETKWPTFRRRHVQVRFLEWKYMNFDWYFTEFYS